MSSARPSRSTRPRPPPSRMATSSAATPSGTLGPARCTKNGPPSASRRSTSPTPWSSRWIARTQSWLGASSTIRVMIASAPGSSIPAARRSRPVVVGGLEAVVAVGQHHELGADRVGDRARSARGRSTCQSEWWKPSSSIAVASGSASPGREQRREPAVERQTPDRVEVGAGGAQQLEPVGLGLRERALVGHDAAAVVVEGERAEHAGGALRDAVVAGEVHAVDRERGCVVGDEHALVAPARERGGGRVVRVGKDQPHRVLRVARLERSARFGLDHVVGWSAHCADVLRAVADAWEGKKSGHVRHSVGGQ